jgi:hypothetical protein
MGIFVASPTIAGRYAQELEELLPHYTYRPRLNDRGKLEWVSNGGNGSEVTRREPRASLWRRFSNRIYRLLPIEDQL